MNTPSPVYKLGLDLNNNSFYIKRDDLLPFSFGGNKARKAEYFFGEILDKKCDVVVTYGSGSSNHCRVVANKAAANGLRTVIISPEENYKDTYNTMLVKSFGAEIVKTPVTEVSQTIQRCMADLKQKHNPYFIQGGGHGDLGTQAYVDAYNEIYDYEKETGIKFDYIFLASGTGTTQAGLVAGKILKGEEDQRIVGISIARSLPRGKQVVIDSVNEYLNDGNDHADEVEFVTDYICGGYAEYDEDVVKTIKEMMLYEGIPMNTTYTGKAFSGMKKYIRNNGISDKNILFIHTGGSPLFFDDMRMKI